MTVGSTRFGVAAVLVAAAAVIASSVSRSRAVGAGDQGEREKQVLQRTITDFETKLAGDPLNPVVGPRLVSDHLLAFSVDSDGAHLDRAAQIAERLVPRALDKAAALARLSAARLARHDFRGAHEAAIAAFELRPTADSSLGALFDAALGIGDYARARAALDGLIAYHGASFSRAVREAQWLHAHGETSSAIGLIEPWCSRLRSRAVSRIQLAWCETRVGDLERARGQRRVATRWYGRAATTVPDYPAAIEGLAGIAQAEQRWTRASELYERVLADAHPDIHLRLAEIAKAVGDATRAAEHERAFLQLTEDDTGASHALALALYLAQSPLHRIEALEVINVELERRRSVEVLELAAWIRFVNGDLSGAITTSDASRTWGAASPTNDYIRARIQEALGHAEPAARLYANALADASALKPYARADHEQRAVVAQ